MPPLALLGTAALQILPRERTLTALLGHRRVRVRRLLAWGMLAPRPELAHATRLAQAVRADTGPRDRVLFWGIHPETYWLADRAPASRYLTAGLLTNYSGGRDGPQVGEKYAVEGAWPVFRREMRRDPPALVVDDSRGKPFAPDRVPSLRRILAVGYAPVARVGGRWCTHARTAEEEPRAGPGRAALSCRVPPGGPRTAHRTRRPGGAAHGRP